MELEEKIEKARSNALWCRRHPSECDTDVVWTGRAECEVLVWRSGPHEWTAQASGPLTAQDGSNLYVLVKSGLTRDGALSQVLVNLDAFIASWKEEPSGNH